ncbi:UNVERIFIED_CONTAM: hypothetical protein FKN15_032213 [Acipenser sinensis]
MRDGRELELLLQKWEQPREAPLSAAPAREALRSPSPEEMVLCPERESFPEPEEGQPREQEVPPLATDKGKEVRSPPTPQPRPPPQRSSLALPGAVLCPLLLDTLLVCLDLPGLDLEPRSLHYQPQFHSDIAAPVPSGRPLPAAAAACSPAVASVAPVNPVGSIIAGTRSLPGTAVRGTNPPSSSPEEEGEDGT